MKFLRRTVCFQNCKPRRPREEAVVWPCVILGLEEGVEGDSLGWTPVISAGMFKPTHSSAPQIFWRNYHASLGHLIWNWEAYLLKLGTSLEQEFESKKTIWTITDGLS